MSIKIRFGLIVLVCLAGALLAVELITAAPKASEGFAPSNFRRASDQTGANLPNINSLQSLTPACYYDPGKNSCFITFQYLYVSAAPNYVISMTVALDGKKSAYYSGFFTTSIFIPNEMAVFKAACGSLGPDGKAGPGLTHSYTVAARDTASQYSTNTGSVVCPSLQPKRIFLPVLRKGN